MRLLAGVFAALVMVIACRAADQPKPSTTLPQGVEEALRQLSAEDYATRERAVGDLKQALGRQLAGMLRTGDPEVESRLAELMEFQNGLCRWALELLKLPKEQRQR